MAFFYTLHTIWKTHEYICMYREKCTVWYLISLTISDNFLKITDDYIYLSFYLFIFIFILNLEKYVLLLLYLSLVLVISEDEETDQFLCLLACYIATETFQH